MTQRRKCEICRTRKIKCDERRPVCGQCHIRRRACTYTYPDSNFVPEFSASSESTISSESTTSSEPNARSQHGSSLPFRDLALKKSRNAPTGSGIFQTFAALQNECPQDDRGRSHAFRESSPAQVKAFSRLTHVPVNETTRLQQALVARLLPSNDIQTHIVIRWGGFLLEIPKRLGSNEALDAATAALLSRHEEICSMSDQINPRAPAVLYYNRALSTLRHILDDAHNSSSTETLCAVMLLMYCQARFDDQFTFFWSPHALGIAQLLRMRGFPSGRNSFEAFLFAALNGTLILQSFANPVIRLSMSEYRMLENKVPNVHLSALDVRHWQLMVRISEIMQHARDAIDAGLCLSAIATQVTEFGRSLEVILVAMRDRLTALESLTSKTTYDVASHAVYQRGYGVALANSAILQSAQRTLSPNSPDRCATTSNLCREVLRISDQAREYGPVAAVWTVHTLICTWCATEETSLKTRVEEALLEYQKDAMGPKAELQMDQLRLLEQRLCLFG